MKLYWIGLVAFVIIQVPACAQDMQSIKGGPIHEAFVTPIRESIAFKATPLAPPSPLTEQVPPHRVDGAQWVDGYWEWNNQWQDFIWITGAWRLTPPKHSWVKGYWEKFPEGWVRIPGFWGAAHEKKLDFFPVRPPDQLDERVQFAPSNDSFWFSGYWYYLIGERDYGWVPGMWVTFDPHWILVPAHYVWRPDGYVFIPAYWDWPLRERGNAYVDVFLEKTSRDGRAFTPFEVLSPRTVLQQLFAQYPDYAYLFAFEYHVHPHFWENFCCVPPWWAWSTWSCFSWHNSWSLWWWYSHSGYPQPLWLTGGVSSMMPPPDHQFQQLVRNVNTPAIVTQNGVVTPSKLFEALKQVTRQKLPIIPTEKGILKKIQEAAAPEFPDHILRPTGTSKKLSSIPEVLKPAIPLEQLPRTPSFTILRGKVPLKPQVERQAPPPVPLLPRPPVPQRPWHPDHRPHIDPHDHNDRDRDHREDGKRIRLPDWLRIDSDRDRKNRDHKKDRKDRNDRIDRKDREKQPDSKKLQKKLREEVDRFFEGFDDND